MTKKAENLESEAMSLVLPSIMGEPVIKYPEAVAESIRQMITRLRREEMFPDRLALVSALRQEGVTYTSYALATILAYDIGAKVCIVDLNWRFPFKSPLIAPDNPGLAGVLEGQTTLDEVIATTGYPNLSIVPCGKIDRAKQPVIARSSALRDLISILGVRFDHLILDVPALLATSDSVPLASLARCCCLLVRQGVTPIEDVRQALDEIAHLEVKGVVMNKVTVSTPNILVKLITGS